MAQEIVKGKLISWLVGIVSFLMTIVTGLIAHYGNQTVTSLKELNQAFQIERTTNAVTDAVQNSRLDELEKQNKANAINTDFINLFAKKPDEITLKNLR